MTQFNFDQPLSNEHKCRVCGVNWGVFNKTRTDFHDNFCPCCSVQLGYEDCNLIAIKNYRKNWLDQGAIWGNDDTEPKGWNKEMALKQIKDNVPEELQ